MFLELQHWSIVKCGKIIPSHLPNFLVQKNPKILWVFCQHCQTSLVEEIWQQFSTFKCNSHLGVKDSSIKSPNTKLVI
jgi:hypothetical protein